MWGATSVITSGEAVEVALWSRLGWTAPVSTSIARWSCARRSDPSASVVTVPLLSEITFQNEESIRHEKYRMMHPGTVIPSQAAS